MTALKADMENFPQLPIVKHRSRSQSLTQFQRSEVRFATSPRYLALPLEMRRGLYYLA
ncbi:hypothetical protein [Pyrobaculum aerophilum]|nr:hypothetical protein [Pyrobaculum aerophilum]